MKKTKLAAAFLAALISVSPALTNSEAVLPDIIASGEEGNVYEGPIEYNDMLFSIREGKENEVMLIRYWGNETDLIVPGEINGYTVTGIGNSVFAHNKGLRFVVENVTFPDSINYFGADVFRNSTVVSVNIPKSLRVIPSYTFYKCSNLETVIFHDDILAVSRDAFMNTDIMLPQNIQDMMAIDDGAPTLNSESHFNAKDDNFTFGIDTDKDTDSLYCTVEGYIGESSDIIIPQNFRRVPIKYIDLSKTDTSAITSVTFPETDTEISVKDNSFSGSLISELNIKSPCVLGKESFADCKSLKTVTFDDDAIIDARAFKGCTDLTSVKFFGRCDLNYYSFMDCTALKEVVIDTSQPIPGDAFNGCTSLMSINSEPVFDSDTGDFNSKYSDFVKSNFYMAEDIGFLNEYTKAQYKKAVDEVTDPGMSDIEKVKALHDWVCNKTKYADNVTPAEYHTDASILLNDSTVCEGYAKACNLLFNLAGIETYYINSSSHAWNIVKIGGHYFHVDSTWDDNGDILSYDHFMKSDSEIKDDDFHSSWSAYIPTSLHGFQNEGTPECKYQLGDVNTDGEISVADLVRMSRYLLSAETENKDDLVLYDLDFDGRASAFDMVLMRQKVLRQHSTKTG